MLKILKREKGFYKTLSFIAFPIAGQSLVSFSLSIADTFFLGFIGEAEIAAATFANSPFFVLSMIIFGAQSGASILISQYFGKGEKKRISEIMGVSTIFMFAIAFVFSTIVFLFPYQIMSFYTPSEELRTLAVEYIVIVAFSFPISVFSQMLFATHRSMGNATTGFVITIITASTNIALNAILIFGLFGFPRMEVAGAALGTLISRIIELIISIVYSKKSSFFKVDFKAFFHPPRFLIRDFFKYGAPVMANEAIWGLGSSLYPAIYGRLPESVVATYVATYSIGINVERIFSVFNRGIGDAACVMIGGQIGKGNYDNAREYGKTIIAVSCIVGCIMGFALFVSSPFIIDIFNITEQTKTVLTVFLVILAIRTPIGSIFYSMLIGMMRAGGDTKIAMMIDITAIWVFGIGTAFIITSFTVNPWLVFLPPLFDELFKVFTASFRISSGKWINNVTVDA